MGGMGQTFSSLNKLGVTTNFNTVPLRYFKVFLTVWRIFVILTISAVFFFRDNSAMNCCSEPSKAGKDAPQ